MTQRGVGLLMLCLAAAPLAGQTPEERRPALATIAHWAKWPAFLAAGGFTALALVRNRDADAVFDGLSALCRRAPTGCRVMGSSYASAEAEALYQETLRIDRSARNWLLAGQITLLASGGMFLIDLIAGDDTPPNIPFRGFRVLADGRRLGLTWEF